MYPACDINLSLYADEWNNFLERVDCKSEEELRSRDELSEELRLWASYRGQTLTRTGMLFCQLFFNLVCQSMLILCSLRMYFRIISQRHDVLSRSLGASGFS